MKECARLREDFEDGGFMAQKKAFWNVANKRMLEDSGEFPREEGDSVRHYKPTNEGELSQ